MKHWTSTEWGLVFWLTFSAAAFGGLGGIVGASIALWWIA